MVRRKLVAVVSVAAVTGALTIAVAGVANGAPAVAWSPCTEEILQRFDCATVKVPMDYSHPDGEQISIAISRSKATEPQRRRGVLFTNPGGPGGTGRDLLYNYLDTPLSKMYDIIGIDVRGLGASTPLNCEVPVTPDPWSSTRPADTEFPRITEYEKQWEEGCVRGGGPFRHHVTTPNTARDLDRVRAALGEEKINYLGVSYGTWLGAVYGQLFPHRLDRSVLDSSLDPGTTWHDQAYDVVDTTKANFDKWAVWTARRDSTFHLGDTPGKVRAAVDDIAGRLAAGPVGGIENQSQFDMMIGQFTRFRQVWASLAKNLQKVQAELPLPTGDPALAESNRRAAAAATRLTEQATTENGVYRTILCDWAWPADLNSYYRDMRQVRDTVPFGSTVPQMAPNNCFFHQGDREPLPVIGKARYPKGLVLAAEGDTQTPLVNGQAMAKTLGSSLIAVRGEGQHGQYAAGGGDPDIPVKRNPCVDDKVNAYLIDGKLPPRRTDCDSVNRPAAIPTDPKPGIEDLIADLGNIAEQLLHAVLPRPAR
ncbi:alpha/beta fold hydrolase [Amycolatopsis sp. EV170708-02-1]|uniref:alpha/beta fold hydrolase n=1 Tax=Amycolatopsis sp. EV170708-02-1 TaxID=2919322 RepID=UPI001F0CAF24|nr:alpha/beta fold hydrolase [Amycolatopsis sp. EV170708-02-1]UMP00764.1 alpha/beta hydrolase [Amycolatopsis sp. EV170708-02-1]